MALEKKQRDPTTKKEAGKAKKDPPKKAEAKAEKPAKKAKAAKGESKKAAPKKEGARKPAAKTATKKEQAKKEAPKPKVKPAPLVVRASSRYVRIAPRKARLIADQVRGMQIEKARALLQFSPRGAAHDIAKLIESAAANAENNHDLVADEMRVAEITVDEGPTLRRFRPRALGRATPINKRTSHIAVALSPEEEI
jgi:ribosomal protein L22